MTAVLLPAAPLVRCAGLLAGRLRCRAVHTRCLMPHSLYSYVHALTPCRPHSTATCLCPRHIKSCRPVKLATGRHAPSRSYQCSWLPGRVRCLPTSTMHGLGFSSTCTAVALAHAHASNAPCSRLCAPRLAPTSGAKKI